ncbi:Uncharacterized protein HZ326_20488 [Fusarium oxysporum f. sp. albedinis]|nr:Uncharacterized protein HZ326_25652 [Fusarium oxysporum f. sp. albedinis]KAJ0136513.1 Uncharacterized protein HZ326_20488 [Fusarium oxysporum f. sp. albedinis]
MLKALGRDRKHLLPTGPAPRTELQKVDDTILQRVPLVDNWIKENHGKLMRTCQSVDLSIIQGVMEKCSGRCCVCYGEADLRSPCCSQFICSPCFEQWFQIDLRCYLCHRDFCQWLGDPLDWNLVKLFLRKDRIDT